ncbi:hypothetical protein CEXT_631141 [Caerostris extrusa]|uniref:Uncharacterized protein n=1 Tax=Caerostris extrusa TaxID=172846 RepID=A0AAV4SD20_CAEEX|nr:hypothetical protein CEXT_631141 [Caerostris extrusa]
MAKERREKSEFLHTGVAIEEIFTAAVAHVAFLWLKRNEMQLSTPTIMPDSVLNGPFCKNVAACRRILANTLPSKEENKQPLYWLPFCLHTKLKHLMESPPPCPVTLNRCSQLGTTELDKPCVFQRYSLPLLSQW